MTAFSEDLQTKILNATLRNIAYTSPNPIYVALFTSWGAGDTPGLEVSGNGYARQAASFAAPVGGVCANAGPSPLTFPTATPNTWGTITHFAIYDAASNGNMMYHNKLTAPVVVQSGDIPQWPPGTLKVTLK